MHRTRYQTHSWDPFAEIRNLQREVNRVFGGSGSPELSGSFPPINLWSDSNSAVLTAELPGFAPDAIDISVLKNHLTIKGKREENEPTEGVVCHRCERDTGSFTRTIALPFEVDNDQVKAGYERGVLTVTLPRCETTKPKRITIESN